MISMCKKCAHNKNVPQNVQISVAICKGMKHKKIPECLFKSIRVFLYLFKYNARLKPEFPVLESNQFGQLALGRGLYRRSGITPCPENQLIKFFTITISN